MVPPSILAMPPGPDGPGQCRLLSNLGVVVLSQLERGGLARSQGLLYRSRGTAEKGGVARAKGEGEKKKECTTECKCRRRRDEKAPWALDYGSGDGGDVEKGRRRRGEKRAMYV